MKNDVWMMIGIFLVIIIPLIYGAYKIKLFSMLWSPFRRQMLNTMPKETPKTTVKDRSHNIQKMRQIEANEAEYIPEKQKLRAMILDAKEELERDGKTSS